MTNKKTIEWKMNTQELIKYIRMYNPYCEHITLTTIFSKMHIGRFHVANWGSPGSGKSESSLVLLEKLDLGNDIIIDNTTTERGLFETFKDFPEQDIILDECNAILRDPAVQDMIKLAMEGKKLFWTKNNSREETPNYKGNIILNANVKIMDSIVDRCFLNKTVMNKEMALEFIDYFLTPKDTSRFIDHLKDVITKERRLQLTMEEVRYVQEFTKSYIKESDLDLGYSRRCILKMLDYFTCAKNLFRKLDDEVKTFVEQYAKLYIINDETPSLMEAIVSDKQLDKVELQKRLMVEGGFSDRHARRLVDAAIKQGELILRGRLVMKPAKKAKKDKDK